jgi:hypothetical protein
MGGTTSACLPDKIDAVTCAQICGTKFSQTLFDSIKGDDGMVEKDAFIRYIQLRNTVALSTNSEHVREGIVKDIFKAYCYPNRKELSADQFLQFLRDIRWMNSKFSSKDAVDLFEKHKEESGLISYPIFRKELLDEISEKKQLDEEAILSRLSRHDSAIIAAYLTRKMRASLLLPAILETPGPVSVKKSELDLQQDAVIKLQSMLRQGNSARLLRELRDVRFSLFAYILF